MHFKGVFLLLYLEVACMDRKGPHRALNEIIIKYFKGSHTRKAVFWQFI